jgi:hypothetical protein
MRIHPPLSITLAFLFLCLLSSAECPPAHAAASFDGVQLHEYCRLALQDEASLSASEHLEYAICLSYVLGVAEGLGSAGGDLCIPNDQGITNTELGAVVFRYLDTHPEQLHMRTARLVISALLAAYPCPVSSQHPRPHK